MFAPQHPGAPSNQPYCAAPNPFNCNYFSPDMQPQAGMEMEPEEGYLPPDPALYNFYSPEQQFMQMPQQPQPPPFTFLRRINKMNWDLIANVDVGTIARTGDTASIEYLMQPIAFANITQEDMKQFGSRSALHAFLILQMAVEILLSKLNTSAAVQQPPAQPQPPQTQSTSQAAQYEARISLLNKDIRARDMIISDLTEKLKFAERTKEEAYKQLRSKAKNPQLDSFIDSQIPTKEKVKTSTIIDSNNETGAIHYDTEYYEYLQQKPIIKFKRKSHHSSSKASDSRSHHSRRSESETKKRKRKSENDYSSESS